MNQRFRFTAAAALIAMTMAISEGGPAADLPIPCASGACGATGPSTWVSSGKATAVYTGNTATIQQTSDRAILNWAQFNVSADGHVVFQQPGASSVALNRIFQDSPSAIFGEVRSNGEIYLINPNGFLFGRGATINVGGLIASTLGISDSVFSSGLLAPQLLQGKQPALQSDGRSSVIDSAGNPVIGPDGKPLQVSLVVRSGAQLSASSGGRILLAAPTIENAGSIQAPGGQIVLAAGDKVYLQASTDPALRGLLVEVDAGGKAWNQQTGQLSAPRGNITLVGLGVNQDGRISATTTVSANGSVQLLARDTTTFSADPSGAVSIAASRGGKLELGPQSSIAVMPEFNDTATAVDEQTQLPSTVDLSGQQVFIHGGKITAPGGKLNVTALANPQTASGGNADSKIRIDGGALIDLSGSNVNLPMASNLVRVELRANELADDPNQRNGALRGQTVYIDRRVGTKIANVQGAIAAIPKSVGERTSAGGKASFISEGDVSVAPNATIKVSGGAITYDGGPIQTTQLVGANGQTYDIGSADPSLTYSGVINPTVKQIYDRWGVTSLVPTPGLTRYESTYVQGIAGGTVQFAAPHLVVNGTLEGHAVSGPYQRSASTINPGGRLIIGLPAGGPWNTTIVDYLSPAVKFVTQPVPTVISDDAAFSGRLTLALPTSYLTSGGFTRTEIYSNDQVTLPAGVPIDLSPNGSLLVKAPRIDVQSNITSVGGSLRLSSVATVSSSQASVRPGIDIGSGVALDVRGTWTNDMNLAGSTLPVDPTLINGGSIDLSLQAPGSELVLGDGAQLHVGGGAWLQSNGQLTPGAGGSIALRSGAAKSALDIGRDVAIDGFGVAGARGGSFLLEATRLKVGQGNSWATPQRIDELNNPGGAFVVGASLFSDYGFSSIDLAASGSAAGPASAVDLNFFEVLPGTSIVARSRSLQLLDGSLTRSTGGTITDFSQAITLTDDLRLPVAVSLRIAPRGYDSATDTKGGSPLGQLTFSSGASLKADTGASVLLSSTGGIYLQGSLYAPAGRVTLQIPSPPDPNVDPGYRPGQRIELGSTALIDVRGTSILTPNDSGLFLGNVLPGGSVTLFANRGSIIMQPHSVIDVSGASAQLDLANSQSLGGYDRRMVSGAGGSVVIRAAEAISLTGDMHAAAGTGDGVASPGGSLTVDLTRFPFNAPDRVVGTFPTNPRVLRLTADFAGDAVSPDLSGLGIVSATRLQNSGFDSLSLRADDRIELQSNVNLLLARALRLDAPVMAVTGSSPVSLSASFVSIGNSQRQDNAAVAATGSGSITVKGDFIELLGSSVWQGIDRATLTSLGDLAFRGVDRGASVTGSVTMAGDLALNAARIYPSTQTQFTVSMQGAGRFVLLGQTGPSPGIPLSVAGSINIFADKITNNGTLIVPFGKLNLRAASSLALGPDSVTSVSGNQTTFLFGRIQNGTQWLYDLAGGATKVTGVPSRQVQLDAPSVNIANSATIDLRGGGDLYAYEWLPGTGGSKDALAAGATLGLYAILPSLRGQYAPYDPQEYAKSTLQSGDSVYLSGIAELPAGVYPLLPARYALLPGAYLINAAPGFQDLHPGQSASLADGTAVVAGYLTYGNTGLGASRFSGFAVHPGSYGRTLAAYQDSLASTYFSKLATASAVSHPVLPADAGRLSMVVGSTLNAAGSVLSAAATGGRAAAIELSATNLEVLGSQVTPPSAGTVQIAGSVLQSWQAGELLIGGRRSADNGSIEVLADSVTLDGGVKLTADAIELVAGQSIDLKSGAVLSSRSGAGGAAPAVLPPFTTVALTGAKAPGTALLAVSDLSSPIAQRPASVGGTPAAILLEAGSALNTRAAVTIDGLANITLDGDILAPGARWALASNSVAFVPQRTGSAGLELTPGLVANLQQAGSLRLSSASSIDLGMSVGLGAANAGAAPTISDMTLVGTSIRNLMSGSNVFFSARTLSLLGIDTSGNSPVTAGTGRLSLIASELDLGPNNLAISGFGQTVASVAGPLIARGSGALSVGGNLSVAAGNITAGEGSHFSINAPAGVISVSRPSGVAAATPIFLGGDLTLNARSIQDNGSITALGGSIALRTSEQLTVGAGAVIDVGGAMARAADRTVGSSGGVLTLASGGGLTASAGAKLNVAGAGDANAGRVVVAAGGAATIDATLNGSASSRARGGSFSLDAGTLVSSLTSLDANLGAGGFTERQSVRVRNGDLSVAAVSGISARQVELVADRGTVDVAGSINASSAGLRSGIRLYGGQGVRLESGGSLRTDASGADGRGGNIELGTSIGTLSLANGSVVSATGAIQKGALRLRAPAVGTDVAIATLGADVSGVSQVIIESVLAPFQVSNAPTPGDFNQINGAVSAYMSSAGTGIRNRLTPVGSVPLVVQPGIELQQTGDMTISDPLDLSRWRFDGQPVALTVRTGGALTISGTISDGFAATGFGRSSRLTLLSDPSASIRLVVGADLTSADPLAVSGGAADLTIGADTTIRTGTGSLSLAASRDIVFSSGSRILTGGLPGAPQTSVGTGPSAFVSDFPTQGGDLHISAGRDLVGSPVTQSITAWQTRKGKTGTPAEWGVNFTKFGWNAGALGGGDFVAQAGRDMVNFSAATGYSRALDASGAAHYFGGGGMQVTAGRDVASGQFFIAHGTGVLDAGGAFSVFRTSSLGDSLGSLLAMGDAQVEVAARGDITLEGAQNPTAVLQLNAPSSLRGQYFTFGEKSRLAVSSTSGNIALVNNQAHLAEFMGDAANGSTLALAVYPASLTAHALRGDVTFSLLNVPSITLFPSAAGQLDIFAGRDVSSLGADVTMSDAAASAIPTHLLPDAGTFEAILTAASSARHANDPLPALITAGRDISNFLTELPKAARLTAGRDIVNLRLDGQNLAASDLTLISAGRDFIADSTATTAHVSLGGRGRLDVLAGRNVDLGFSSGLVTVGALVNPNLPVTAGADLTVFAGLGKSPDYAGFLNKIIAPSADYQAQLIAYVQSTTGASGLTLSQAEVAFGALSADAQRPLIVSIFFSELVKSGREANTTPKAGFARGYSAIDSLFPDSRASGPPPGAYAGDLTLPFSRIYTLVGGNISLLVPGGLVDVGLANPPQDLGLSRGPSELGIVAQGKGSVNIYSVGDVLVNQSRVFTLLGGDIAVWSTLGNIDAGRGAKSAVSAPPPRVLVDANGHVTLDFAGAVAGSGIRTIVTQPDLPPGNVDLVAPFGIVNAGDAGIGSAGNINIAAQQVIGLDNIQFGGASTGVPSQVGNLGASLSGVSSTASSASNASTSATAANADKETAAPIAQNALSWLDVFVTGLGEENCKQDDMECLKRQKAKP